MLNIFKYIILMEPTYIRASVQNISRLVLRCIDLLHHAAAVCHQHDHHGGGRHPAGANTAVIVLCWSSRRRWAGPPSCLACGAVHPRSVNPQAPCFIPPVSADRHTVCCFGMLAVIYLQLAASLKSHSQSSTD